MKNKLSNQLSYKRIIIFSLFFFILYYSRQKQPCSQNVISHVISAQNKAIKKEINDSTKSTRSTKIEVKNNITPEMLVYNHWSGSYKPTVFEITIVGNRVAQNAIIETEVVNDIITIRYDYSFMNGYKTGSREIQFLLQPGKKQYGLTFSWHAPMHLVLENAEIKQTNVVAFNTELESKKT